MGIAEKQAKSASFTPPLQPEVSMKPGTISIGSTDFTAVEVIAARTRSVNVRGVDGGTADGVGNPAATSRRWRNSRGSARKYSSHSAGRQVGSLPSNRSCTWIVPLRFSWILPGPSAMSNRVRQS
jgi:hypothetical protein